ncbi:hypothetical protein M5689_001085 [Euphorbia peplus]|nr:hypothetical protein M5689_001085 [Euphorbia peplus]
MGKPPGKFEQLNDNTQPPNFEESEVDKTSKITVKADKAKTSFVHATVQGREETSLPYRPKNYDRERRGERRLEVHYSNRPNSNRDQRDR